MRAFLAAAFVIAGLQGAGAADLAFIDGYSGFGARAGQVVTYDFQPGVVVRPYWLTPWRARHYFPAGDGHPRLGRDEDLSAVGSVPQPAEDFKRFWSTTSVLPAAPRFRAPGQVPPDDLNGDRFVPPPLSGK